MTRILRSRDSLAVGFLIAWPFVYFWQITLGQGVWLGTDTIRTYFPLGVELSHALSQARLPLWTTGIYAGFPLLADGQIGALYPINLLLYRFLPASLALPYGMLFHLAWAACGMYALARSWRVGVEGALLAGLVFSFSGVFFTRLMHTTIILTGAWLPWLIVLQDRFQQAQLLKKPTAAIWFFLSVLALAAQFLSGFPQIAFLNSLAFVVIGFCGRWLWHTSDIQVAPRAIGKQVLRGAIWTVLPVLLGAGIAAIQLLPTIELVGYSLRGGATSQSFVTSYSLPPAFLSQFIFPFAQGEPSEANNEYLAYFGFAPLALALLAPFLKRDRQTFFIFLFALAALSLAFGELNPVYQFLYRLPGFGFFRVPARYLYLFVFAAALLAAGSLDELARRLDTSGSTARLMVPIAIFVSIIIALAYSQPLDFWMSAWRWLPWLLVMAVGVVLWLARSRKVARETLAGGLIALTLFDLGSYAPAFLATIAPIVPAANVLALPHSLEALGNGQTLGRFFTDGSIFPSPPALRGSLFSNTALIYGEESAQAYSSLALGRHEAYLIDPSPTMLNLMNVHYFMVPLEPRLENKSATPYGTIALDVLNNEAVISPTLASGIEITTFTERAGNLNDGTEIGEMVLRRSDGGFETFPLQLGIETADWDYVRQGPLYSLATVAHSFPGFWRSFGTRFTGHTYLARFAFEPGEIIGVNIKVLRPDVRLTIESVHLCNAGNCSISLAKLTGKDDFALAYMSDTVAAWENLDARPRAFVVHNAEIADDNSVFGRLKKQQLDADREVLLSDDTTPRDRALQEPSDAPTAQDAVQITNYQSEDVTISVGTGRAGYLVLADTWYPGWIASVDGKPTPISRADFLFRAVPIEPGQHTVTFKYQPMSFRLGAVLSALSLLVAGFISIVIYRHHVSTL